MDHVRRTSEHRIGPVVTALAIAAGMLLGTPTPALANADDEAKTAVNDARDKIRRRKYQDALEALKEAQAKCRGEGCSDSVMSRVYLHQGLAYAQSGDADEAQKRFEWALAKDGGADPDDKYVTRKVKKSWQAAKKNVDSGSGAQPPAPPGRLDAEQQAILETAKTLLESDSWEECMGALLAIPEFPEGKFVLAQCQAVGGLLTEAKRDAEGAKEMAEADGNDALVAKLDEYLEQVNNEVPKIQLLGINKVGIKKPKVTVDDAAVPADKIEEPIPHNPGKANIKILGDRGCWKFRYQQEVSFEKNETLNFDLSKQELPSPFELCMEDAKTPREQQACRQKCGVPDEDLNFKAGLEVSSYNDNDNVDVLSPSLYLAAVHPTEGWNVSGHAMVDVVTTASADIVATASRRFDDIRVAGALGGGYKVGPVTAGISGAVSVESDYIGRSVGANVSADVFDKMASPFVGYNFGFDILGRADTDFEIFSRDLYRHTINAGTSIIFNGSTVGVIAGTVEIDKGDSSKPYRHVAMFPGTIVADLPKGAAASLVAAARLDAMPLEQLPEDRLRYAVLLRGMKRFDESTLRADERLYMDDWGQMATTTDARYFIDLFDELTLNSHLRFHFQGPVDFWQFAYVGEQQPDGSIALPAFRTGDRELGPLLAGTLGLGARYQFTEVFSMALQAEGTYTRFLDHLYITDRIGVFTATTAEIDIQ